MFLHGTSAIGHLQTNVRREPRVCFELDEPDQVFDYGRFECDSGLAYRSVILFGRIRIAEDTATKQWFCERLMEKYGKPDSIRPKNFFPRLDIITVYAHDRGADDRQAAAVADAVRAVAGEGLDEDAARAAVDSV